MALGTGTILDFGGGEGGGEGEGRKEETEEEELLEQVCLHVLRSRMIHDLNCHIHSLSVN